MKKLAITAYLKNDSKTIGTLLARFNRLKSWNERLRECLPGETLLLTHCHVVGLDKTSLIVIADNPHWVTRFRCFIPDLLVQFRRYEDFKQLQAICCKVRPPHFRPTRPKRKPLVISGQTADILQEAANKVTNGKLKKVLMKMAEREEDGSE
ncbi:MAG TPA: hypothetical protein VLJ15_05135 [Gammaproteobacteria bacterium]|nr:hypothetical protein [Gammaproteobacteria bacterium]